MKPCDHALALGVLLAMASSSLAQSGRPPVREADFIPAAWTTFSIQWRNTWDETLKANPENAWRNHALADRNLRHAAEQVLLLRRIELLKAMIEHFPAEKEKHREAYLRIAETYSALGMNWWAAQTGWTMARTFPDDKATLAAGYQRMLAWKFGSTDQPDARHWAFAAREAMDLLERGMILPATPAAAAACNAMNDLITRQGRYDEIQPHLARLEKLESTVPAAKSAAARLLAFFGQARAKEPAEITGFAKHFELETRFAAMLGGLKLREGGPVSAADVQGVLNLAARSDALGARDAGHYESFAVMVDQALRALPPESLRDVRLAQGQGASSLATAVRLWGDRDELAAAVRRYPWAAELHALQLELGEQDLRAGRRHWAIAAFQDVVDHAADPQLRAAGVAGLWMALAQCDDRPLLQAAMTEVADTVPIPWRGGTIPAGQLKAMLSGADTATVRDEEPDFSSHGQVVSPDGKRVYRLLEGEPAAVAALDARTGRTLWTTTGDPQWQDLTPAGGPAEAAGRLYVLAREDGAAAMWHLVCLAGPTGRTLWSRRLGFNAQGAAAGAGGPAAVSIARGAVYCSTNMGLVARCDVRDGTVAWVRAYSRTVNRSDDSPNRLREGSAPILVGNVLLLAPRDHSGVLALDAATGRQLWQTLIVPSDRIVGVSGGTLITANDSWLCALAVDSGHARWMRRFDEPLGSRVALRGATISAVSGRTLLSIAPDSGKTLRESPYAPAVESAHAVLPAFTPLRPIAPIGEGPLSLPLEEVWALPGQRPVLLKPSGQAKSNAWCVQSGPDIACVGTDPRWAVVWQRHLAMTPQRVVYDGRVVLAAAGEELLAYSADDGRRKWLVHLPFAPARVGTGRGLVYAATDGRHSPLAAAVLDVETGKLLWCRTLGCDLRMRGVPVGMTFHDENEATFLTVDWPLLLFGDMGWQEGRVIVEARTGKIQRLQIAPGGLRSGPDDLFVSLRTSRFIGRQQWTPVALSVPAGAAGWDRWLDALALRRYPEAHSLHRTQRGYYACALDKVFFFDPATQRETVYELGIADRLHVCSVLALREVGRSLVIVAAHTSEVVTVNPREHRSGSDPAQSRLRVHVFDSETGRHLSAQTLTAIPCGQGIATDASLTDTAVIITAPDGVHVFRRQEAPARAFEAFAAAVRGLGQLGRSVEPAALSAANAKALQALAAYRRALTHAKVSDSQRQELLDDAAAAVAAARAQYLQPILTPAPGPQLALAKLTITTRLKGTEIRYCLDGSDPVTGGTVYSGPVALAGKVVVNAVADLPGKIAPSSPTAGGEYRPLTARPASDPGPVEPGLAWTWHTGRHSSVSDVFTGKPRQRGVSKNFDISAWYSTDVFGVLFTGYIRIPVDGAYTFFVSSDDGSQLYIGDTLVVDNDRHHPVQMARGEIALRAGLHPLRLGYFEEVGGEVLRVEYAGPGIDRRDVPDAMLFYKP